MPRQKKRPTRDLLYYWVCPNSSTGQQRWLSRLVTALHQSGLQIERALHRRSDSTTQLVSRLRANFVKCHEPKLLPHLHEPCRRQGAPLKTVQLEWHCPNSDARRCTKLQPLIRPTKVSANTTGWGVMLCLWLFTSSILRWTLGL